MRYTPGTSPTNTRYPSCAMAEPHYRLLHVNTDDDVLVLTIAVEQVEGDAVAHELQRELVAAAIDSKLSRVIVDFQNVQYISSVAFSPLLALATERSGRANDCLRSDDPGGRHFLHDKNG